MILVPRETPGLNIERMLPVFGFDDAPHGHAEIVFDNVRVPVENILLGEGRGFEIAQGRLGPDASTTACAPSAWPSARWSSCASGRWSASAFGKPLAEQGVTIERIAKSRILIDQARLLTLHAAWRMDTVGNKEARRRSQRSRWRRPRWPARWLTGRSRRMAPAA